MLAEAVYWSEVPPQRHAQPRVQQRVQAQAPPRFARQRPAHPHVSTKPYSCALCGKDFNYRGSLLKHRSVHRGATRCPICNLVFNRSSYIKHHLLTVHNLPPDQLQLYYQPARGRGPATYM